MPPVLEDTVEAVFVEQGVIERLKDLLSVVKARKEEGDRGRYLAILHTSLEKVLAFATYFLPDPDYWILEEWNGEAFEEHETFATEKEAQTAEKGLKDALKTRRVPVYKEL